MVGGRELSARGIAQFVRRLPVERAAFSNQDGGRLI